MLRLVHPYHVTAINYRVKNDLSDHRMTSSLYIIIYSTSHYKLEIFSVHPQRVEELCLKSLRMTEAYVTLVGLHKIDSDTGELG